MDRQTQEALKMAIEALSQDEGWFEPEAAIQACKEALASNSEALATEQVREDDVQSAHEPDLIWQDGKIKKRKDLNLYGGEKFYTHPAPEQEPFGYWVEYGEEKDFDMAFRYPDKDDYYPSDIKAVTKLYTHPAPQPAQEPVARIEVFNLLTKNGAFAIKEEWLWNIRYLNSKGLIKEFPNEYPSEKKYAIQSAKYWADFLNCKIVEVDNRGNK